jgi:Tfp pilus assembly protein PilF
VRPGLIAAGGIALLGVAFSWTRQYRAAEGDLWTSSLSELRIRMQSRPGDAGVATRLGLRYLLEQRLPEAGRTLDQAVQLDPRSYEGYYLRGLLRASEGNRPAARADFEHALRLRPDFPPVRLRLGKLSIDEGEFRRAVEQLKEYVRQEPLDEAGYYWLGLAALAAGSEKESRWALERAVELNPDAAPYHLALGGWYLDTREGSDPARAEQEFRTVVRLAPSHWLGHYRLAVAMMHQGHLREAGAELEEAVRLQPDAREAAFLLPQVYRQLGDRAKADRYQRAAELLARTPAPPRGAAGAPGLREPGPRAQP